MQGRHFCQLHNKKRYVRTSATHNRSAPGSARPDEIDRLILRVELYQHRDLRRYNYFSMRADD